ncbi:MAG: hypothetical protein ACKOA5_06630 [Actinomycetota bacterium]
MTATKGRATPKKSAKKPVKKSSPAKKSGATKSGMSKAHKAALAQGRVEGRVIRTYLDVLEANRPKRGRKRTIDSIVRRLGVIRKEMALADTVTKLRLTQERMDLERELKVKKANADIGKLESQFVKVAHAYSTRNGTTYTAWREVGVSAQVLKRAGIAPDA